MLWQKYKSSTILYILNHSLDSHGGLAIPMLVILDLNVLFDLTHSIPIYRRGLYGPADLTLMLRHFLRVMAFGPPLLARRLTEFMKNPFETTEAVSVQVALRSYTAWAARQLFLEEQIGSIAIGKRADLVIWDRNPYTVPTADLKEMRCEMTLFDGQIIYKTEAFILE